MFDGEVTICSEHKRKMPVKISMYLKIADELCYPDTAKEELLSAKSMAEAEMILKRYRYTTS